jgi:hypothetical protein
MVCSPDGLLRRSQAHSARLTLRERSHRVASLDISSFHTGGCVRTLDGLGVVLEKVKPPDQFLRIAYTPLITQNFGNLSLSGGAVSSPATWSVAISTSLNQKEENP